MPSDNDLPKLLGYRKCNTCLRADIKKTIEKRRSYMFWKGFKRGAKIGLLASGIGLGVAACISYATRGRPASAPARLQVPQ
jgi:hypothetical protein